LGFNWGVEGVAIATVIAEISALILGLFLCYDRFKDNSWPSFQAIFSTERLKNMLSINLDILLRSIMLQAIFVSFLLYGGKFGDVKLAANQILLQFLHIAAHGLDGFAFAAETLVGQAFGRKDRTILRKSVTVTSKLAFSLCLIMAIIFFFIGSSLIDLMTTAEDVRSEAKGYIVKSIKDEPIKKKMIAIIKHNENASFDVTVTLFRRIVRSFLPNAWPTNVSAAKAKPSRPWAAI
jgi:MATE family multidrug resistance protein